MNTFLPAFASGLALVGLLAGCSADTDGMETAFPDDAAPNDVFTPVDVTPEDVTTDDGAPLTDANARDVSPFDATARDVPRITDAPRDTPALDVSTRPDVTSRPDVFVLDRPTDQPSPVDRPVTPTGACTTLGPWVASAPFASGDVVSHPLPSFAVGSYFYVHTMRPGGAQRRLFSARANDDGSLGPWQTASDDHGGGPHGFTAVVADGQAYHFRNGHIARYPLTADGRMNGDVALVERSTQTSFGGNLYVWDSATVATPPGSRGWVFHLGGFSFAPYAYRPNVFRSAVPVEASFTRMGLDHPVERPGRAAWVQPAGAAHGFVVTGESGGGARLWRARVTSAGTIDAWAALPNIPAGTGNQRGELFALGDTLFAVRGARVFTTRLDPSGTPTSWASAPSLPEDQVNVTWGDGHQEGASWGVLRDTVYLSGPTRVFYARIVRNAPCGG